MRVILYYMGVVNMFALRNSEVSATQGVGLDSIASNVEQSVPNGNVLITRGPHLSESANRGSTVYVQHNLDPQKAFKIQ